MQGNAPQSQRQTPIPLNPDLIMEQAEDSGQEAGYGQAQPLSLSSDPRLKLFAVFINFLVLCELCIAMYLASQDPERLTPVFFKVFFTLLLPTVVAAFVGRWFIAKAAR